jgi:hypothetical protein
LTFIWYIQGSKWAGICLYTIRELLFVPEFHISTYEYIISIYPFPCF